MSLSARLLAPIAVATGLSTAALASETSAAHLQGTLHDLSSGFWEKIKKVPALAKHTKELKTVRAKPAVGDDGYARTESRTYDLSAFSKAQRTSLKRKADKAVDAFEKAHPADSTFCYAQSEPDQLSFQCEERADFTQDAQAELETRKEAIECLQRGVNQLALPDHCKTNVFISWPRNECGTACASVDLELTCSAPGPFLQTIEH